MMRLTGQRQRKTWVRAAVACGLALLVVAVAGAAAPTKRPGLDRSYGTDGVIKVPSAVAERDGSWSSVSGFGGIPDGSAYAVGSAQTCAGIRCTDREFLMRFGPNGARDGSFGDRGMIFLGGKGKYPNVVADGAGRAVVIDEIKGGIELRRFKADGGVDRSFGRGGTVKISEARKEGGEPELLKLPDGRLMVVLVQALSGKGKSYETAADKVRVVQLLPDGGKDRRFGRSGTLTFKVPRPGVLEAIARTADGGMIFGGATWGSAPREAWLWRVTAAGKADRPFNRNAARSLRRLGPLGEFPDLNAVVAEGDGTVAAVGTIQEHLGFVLRLKRDGHLATDFGTRGLAELPASVEDAVGGSKDSVFIVGQGKRHWYYSAYRVLADGRLDPGYRGARGIKVPLPGEGVSVQSLGRGRALVTNGGYFECREGCPPEPGMARFLE